MTGINDLKKGQSIFSISKYTWNKATQACLVLLQTDYYLTLWDTKETEDREKSNPPECIPTKIP